MTSEELKPKGERTRQSILAAAYDLFLTQGYSATSMRQIADQAGIVAGSIYNHFPGKDEIFQALIIEKHPYLQILPVLQRAPGDTVEEFVRNASRLVQEELVRQPGFIKLMFIEVVEFKAHHFPKLLEVIVPQAFPLIQRFTTPGSGVRQEIPVPTLIRAFIGSILAYYMTDFLLTEEPPLPGLRQVTLEDFMDIFLHGILEKQESE